MITIYRLFPFILGQQRVERDRASPEPIDLCPTHRSAHRIRKTTTAIQLGEESAKFGGADEGFFSCPLILCFISIAARLSCVMINVYIV